MYFVDNKLSDQWSDPEVFWARGEEELDMLQTPRRATIEPSDDIVEIGCGVGRMTPRARPPRRRRSRPRRLPRMLELARDHGRGLDGVDWLLGDGVSLAGVDVSSADVCISHVVFQHIPQPAVTLGYVREIGRVLRPGGWAAFQVSNAPYIHRRRTGREGVGIALRGLTGRGPRGQADPAWLGSAIDLGEARTAAGEGGMEVERVAGEGTQLCFVLTRRRS